MMEQGVDKTKLAMSKLIITFGSKVDTGAHLVSVFEKDLKETGGPRVHECFQFGLASRDDEYDLDVLSFAVDPTQVDKFDTRHISTLGVSLVSLMSLTKLPRHNGVIIGDYHDAVLGAACSLAEIAANLLGQLRVSDKTCTQYAEMLSLAFTKAFNGAWPTAAEHYREDGSIEEGAMELMPDMEVRYDGPCGTGQTDA